MSEGVRCMWMRGGTSKGGYFLAEDLPRERDAFLLRAMGSPDPRQIDGMGGADPLASKVAVVGKSSRPGIDVDYLFLQVSVEEPVVSDGQNCGNILAGVGPFALERGLVPAAGDETGVAVYMENSGQVAVATVMTPGGRPEYGGAAAIDGVPGTAAPVSLEFWDTRGSACGTLLPTGNAADEIDGIAATMIDNGMPVVVLRAEDLGVRGDESPAELDANADLKMRLESLRRAAGPRMNLGAVDGRTVPKMTLVSPPRNGGAVSTRTFIPDRCHAAIGVLGAVTVATACLLPGSVAAEAADVPSGRRAALPIEHPTGKTTVLARLGDGGDVVSAAVLRTARKLFDGYVFG